MMQLRCPWCGNRNYIEFTWGGPADIVRPADPGSCSDSAWASYLYVRRNPAGPQVERWCHTYGCGQWFEVLRNTVTHQVDPIESTEGTAEVS